MINFANRIRFWIEDKRESYYEKRLKKQYPNWDCRNWIGDLEFIWGIKSYDCLVSGEANIHTMNDIEIDYDHKEKKYLLSIETAYIFKDENAECEYLKALLKRFEKYMDKNNIKKDCSYNLFCNNCHIDFKADSIQELYVNFKMFVNGFVSLYEQNI